MKVFDSRRVLIGASTGALVMLSLALFGLDEIPVIAFPLVGLFASVMWLILISLALNSVAEYPVRLPAFLERRSWAVR